MIFSGWFFLNFSDYLYSDECRTKHLQYDETRFLEVLKTVSFLIGFYIGSLHRDAGFDYVIVKTPKNLKHQLKGNRKEGQLRGSLELLHKGALAMPRGE